MIFFKEKGNFFKETLDLTLQKFQKTVWAKQKRKRCKGVIWFFCKEKYVFLLWIL